MRRILVAIVLVLAVLAGAGIAEGAPPHRDPCRPGDRACWTAHIQHQAEINAWWAEIKKQQEYERLLAFAAAVDAAKKAAQQPHYRHGQCGGDLPPCSVMMRESGGNITAQNPRSSASGKWQFLDSTWRNHRGYAKARYAPEWVQDEKARIVWAGGRGCSHWSACGRRS